MRNVTVTQNISVVGGGVGTIHYYDTRVRIDNTIISQNYTSPAHTAASNLDGPIVVTDNSITDRSYNDLVGTGSMVLDSTNLMSVDISNLMTGHAWKVSDDPNLQPLQNNGGPTPTHALFSTSIAIDHGIDSYAADPLPPNAAFAYDQRGTGYSRISGAKVDIGAYESHAPTLPGDYNRNGFVDGADYVVYRKTLGTTVTPFTGADGNGDGMITVADYAIWRNNFGATTSGSGSGTGAAYVLADFNQDGIVNQADHDLWLSTYGSTTDLRADGNLDGIVDLADLGVWQEMVGVTTLDSLAAFGDMNGDNIVDSADMDLATTSDQRSLVRDNFGMVRADEFPLVLNGTDGRPLDVLGAAPAVVDVMVSGNHYAGIVGSGEQLRSVNVVNPNSISIQFSEEVLVTSDALQVINLDGTSPGAPTTFVYDLATQIATWTFGSPFADGRYLLRLADSAFDLSHDALDGEFTNPWSLGQTGTSVLRSGDGVAGGEFRFRFTVLAGDTDHNNIDGTANYQNWKSYEPGMIYVSTTSDDFDGDLSFGDVSLREAVNFANGASEATTVVLPTGRYTLSRTGAETTTDVALNDIDITGNVKIEGYGPGISIIDNSGLVSAPVSQARSFDVNGAARRLELSQLTVANGSSLLSGQVASVSNGATMEIVDSAIVNHTAYAGGTAIIVTNAVLVVSRSVFSNNDVSTNYGGAAISLSGTTSAPASITVGESIFAQNVQPGYGGSTRYNIKVSGTVTKVNNGMNMYDYAGGGFFDTTAGVGDYLGTSSYVVTSIADSFGHADDLEALSLREAVDLANTTAGVQEIWVPAWKFTLTRERTAPPTSIETDIAQGDLEMAESLTIRGVNGSTSVAWRAGAAADAVFELLGDYNGDRVVDSADYVVWAATNGSTNDLRADGNDDGVVNQSDYDVWRAHFGYTLTLSGVL